MLARGEDDDAAYVLEVESWVTGPLRVIALAACVVVDEGMIPRLSPIPRM
jgi:hypothetical protein